MSSSRKKLTVLEALTPDGEKLHFRTGKNLTADHGVRLVWTQRATLSNELVVLLDHDWYFYAKDLGEFVSDDRSIDYVDDTAAEYFRSDGFEVGAFPVHLAELIPAEGCWKELNNWFVFRLIEYLAELETVLSTAHAEIALPTS